MKLNGKGELDSDTIIYKLQLLEKFYNQTCSAHLPNKQKKLNTIILIGLVKHLNNVNQPIFKAALKQELYSKIAK